MSLPTTAPAQNLASTSQALIHRRMAIISIAAFVVRVSLVFLFHTYILPPSANHHSFGFETGSIAGSLATGHGFSSPFGVQSGPTTWIAPVYPAIVAGVMKIFGLFSTASAIVMFIFNSLCAALTIPFIYRIGRRVFDERSAEVASWLWALVPFFAFWPVTWIWETGLSALLCAVVFSFTLEIDISDWQAWAGLGVLWGVIGLTSPSLLAFIPASFLYPAWKLRKSPKVAVSRVLLATLFFVVAIAPWLARNEAVFHRPIFLRGNFFFEMSLSNFHTSSGEAWGGLHPIRNLRVLKRYIDMGEPDFVAEAKQRVFTFIRTYPGEFAQLIATRVVHFWDGEEMMYEPADTPLRSWMVLLTSVLTGAGLLVAALRKYSWQLFGWTLLLYPIPYYLTSTNPRYRHPIEPIMVVLMGFFCVECWRAWNQRRAKVLGGH